LVGRAFRVETDSVRRTELIVLLTPHVVRDRQESRNATAAFRSRLKGMQRDLNRYDSERPDYGSGQPAGDAGLDPYRVSPPIP
jgi:type II secretory pathway component GspD/PulD (secretin)